MRPKASTLPLPAQPPAVIGTPNGFKVRAFAASAAQLLTAGMSVSRYVAGITGIAFTIVVALKPNACSIRGASTSTRPA